MRKKNSWEILEQFFPLTCGRETMTARIQEATIILLILLSMDWYENGLTTAKKRSIEMQTMMKLDSYSPNIRTNWNSLHVKLSARQVTKENLRTSPGTMMNMTKQSASARFSSRKWYLDCLYSLSLRSRSRTLKFAGAPIRNKIMLPTMSTYCGVYRWLISLSMSSSESVSPSSADSDTDDPLENNCEFVRKCSEKKFCSNDDKLFMASLWYQDDEDDISIWFFVP